jgi:hypothetical protein
LLELRELAEVSACMTRKTGLDYAETKPGDRITATYRRILTLELRSLRADRAQARLQPPAVALSA